MIKKNRLGKIALEFNISPDHIVSFLAGKGIAIENRSNLILSNRIYELICERFSSDKLLKEQSNEFSIHIVENYSLPPFKKKNYEFVSYKCVKCRNYEEYLIKASNLNLIHTKYHKIWSFTFETECVKCKNEIILEFEIQENSIEVTKYKLKSTGAEIIYKQQDSIGESDNKEYSDDDPHENFRWGGLEGEEAFIGYWNTE